MSKYLKHLILSGMLYCYSRPIFIVAKCYDGNESISNVICDKKNNKKIKSTC